MLFAKRSLASLALAIPLATGAAFAQAEDGPLAPADGKFLGSVYSPTQIEDFEKYFNQVVAENAGKWGAVANNTNNPLYFPEDYQDDWFTAAGGSWHGGLDESFEFAKENGFPYRMHVMVWGNQQPRWIVDLDPEDQLTAIEAWFDVVVDRYGTRDGGFDFVEVVNEPINDAPDSVDTGSGDNEGGNYIEALGGAGETGWDWVINSFQMARDNFPEGTQLMLNEYAIVSGGNNLTTYIEMVNLLNDRDLIDAVGVQAHAFSTVNTDTAQLRSNIDRLAETGVPIYVTEMDIDGPTDQAHLEEFRRVFPVFWEHEAVEGVTLWGFRPGMWRTDEEAFLVREDGSERPAMQWLRCYLDGGLGIVPGQEFRVPSDQDTQSNFGQVLDCGSSESSPADDYVILSGSGQAFFEISDTAGLRVVEGQTPENGETYTLDIAAVAGDETSEPATVTIEVSGSFVAPPSSDLPGGGGSSSSSTNGLFLLMLVLLGGVRWMRRK